MDYDIVVVGAGPAGLSFAKSVSGAGLRMALIEKQPLESLQNPDFDGRDIANTDLAAVNDWAIDNGVLHVTQPIE